MSALVRLSGEGPLHRQIYESVRESILRGRLKPQTRLPATRVLASELGVSRKVALQAYDSLVDEGYAESRVGSGTYVAASLPEVMLTADRAAARSERPGYDRVSHRLSSYARRLSLDAFADLGREERPLRYDFRYGGADRDALPLASWRRLVGRRLREPGLNYGEVQGSFRLRAAIADYLGRARAIECSPDEVMIVSGSQQGLDLVARLLIDPGDRVAIENPHYRGARETFVAAGAELLEVPVDDQGMVVDVLPKRRGRTRLAYVTPSHQFPTGEILSLSRRLALLDWAERADCHILEDDYDGEYRYDARPLEALRGLGRPGRVIYLGTFSKVLFPALRLGYLVLPEALLPHFRAAKWLSDRHTPQLQCEAMADFIESGGFESHLRRSRTILASRRRSLLEALERELGSRVELQGADAGVHLLAWLPELAVATLPALVETAAASGVGVETVDHCYSGRPERAGLLLGYQSLGEEEIPAAVKLLVRAVESVSSRR